MVCGSLWGSTALEWVLAWRRGEDSEAGVLWDRAAPWKASAGGKSKNNAGKSGSLGWGLHREVSQLKAEGRTVSGASVDGDGDSVMRTKAPCKAHVPWTAATGTEQGSVYWK